MALTQVQEGTKEENAREIEGGEYKRIKGGEEGGKQGKERAEAGEAGAGGKR